MVTLEEDAQTLVDFGFTFNQAKIYAAITRLQLATVGGISRLAKVRREHVYRTLPKLEKMGLVERMLGTPETIKAIPVEDAFSVLIKRQKEEAESKVSALMVEAKTFVEHFRQRDWDSIPEDAGSQFSLLSEKDIVMSKMATVMRNAKKEIVIVASRRKLAKLMFFFGDLLKKSLRKGVHVQIITEIPQEQDALPRIIEENISPGIAVELRYSKGLSTHYTIADDKEMIMETSPHADFAEAPCLWTNNNGFVALTKKDFTNSWRSSLSWVAADAQAVSRRAGIVQ
jgi:sugar-specific transcriptional regulator TrmB